MLWVFFVLRLDSLRRRGSDGANKMMNFLSICMYVCVYVCVCVCVKVTEWIVIVVVAVW